MGAFLETQFQKESDFAPNYVMPDKNTILRCLEKESAWHLCLILSAGIL